MRQVQVISYRMFRSPSPQPPIGSPFRKPQAAEMRALPGAEPIVLLAYMPQRLFEPKYFHQSASRAGIRVSGDSLREPVFPIARQSLIAAADYELTG